MTDTQRVTDEFGPVCLNDVEPDKFDSLQAQAATIAEQAREIDRLGQANVALGWQSQSDHARAKAAESALATATARIEKLEAALREAFKYMPEDHPVHDMALAALEDKPHD